MSKEIRTTMHVVDILGVLLREQVSKNSRLGG